jgi:hypothetical protein
MNFFLKILCVFIFVTNINGQVVDTLKVSSKYKKNIISIDGSSIIWWSGVSINYEREILSFHYLIVCGRLGTGAMTSGNVGGGRQDGIVIKPTICLMTNTNNNRFELDFGLIRTISGNVFIDSYNYNGNFPLINIGYRYQERWFSYRVYIGTTGVGMGLGYTF